MADNSNRDNRGGRGSHGASRHVNPQALVQFHYDRPAVGASAATHTASGTSRRAKKTHSDSMSKEEYVQASFRFVISPLADPFEPAWYSAEAAIPWESIETVVVPLNQENSLLCPICLDTTKCPRITRCGHTYCATCLYRHMTCDRSNAQKCPMCLGFIVQRDLRHVLFMVDDDAGSVESAPEHLVGDVHPFYMFQTPSIPVTVSSPAPGKRKKAQTISLRHLIVQKGRCAPLLPTDLPTDGAPLPNKSARQGSGSLSSTVSAQRTLQQQLQLLAQAMPCELLDPLDALSTSHSNKHTALYSRIMFRPPSRCLEVYETEMQLLRDLRMESISNGDTEALPAIDHFISLLLEQRDTLLQRLQSQFIVDIMLNDHFAWKLRGTAPTVDLSAVVQPPQIQQDGTSFDIYQAVSGALVFLHPLCVQCLQEESLNSFRPLPEVIVGRIIDAEPQRLSTQVRLKPAALRHLPSHSFVIVVELDMQPLVSPAVYEQFAAEFARRDTQRRERKKKEQRAMQRAQQRMKQQQRQQQQASAVPDTFSSFPSEATSAAAVFDDAPTLQAAYASSRGDAAATEAVPVPPPSLLLRERSRDPKQGFSEITQMHGYFPSLSDFTQSAASPHSPTPPPPPDARQAPTTGKGASWGRAVQSPSVPSATPAMSTSSAPPSRNPASLVKSNASNSGPPSMYSASGAKVSIRSAQQTKSTQSTSSSTGASLLALRLEGALNMKTKGKQSKKKTADNPPPASISDTASAEECT